MLDLVAIAAHVALLDFLAASLAVISFALFNPFGRFVIAHMARLLLGIIVKNFNAWAA